MRALAICSIIMVAVACAPGNEATESDADAVTDSVSQRADSAAARADADSVADMTGSAGRPGASEAVTRPTPRPATGAAATDVSVSSTSAAIRGDSVPRRDSIIGRDSAFGPRYRIDSAGKLVPIRRP